MTSKRNKPRILLTSGEPAGIGPDLIIKLSQIKHDYDITVIGDPDLLNQRAKLLSIPFNTKIISDHDVSNDLLEKDSLKILPIKLNEKSTPGILNVKNAAYIINMLNILSKKCPIIFPVHPRTRSRISECNFK